MTPDSLRTLIESAPDGFYVHDVQGNILDVNSQSCADLGYSRDELLRMTINDISYSATPVENAAIWLNAPPGTSMKFRQVALRKNGSTFPIEISLTCHTISEQKLFLGLARDVSEREASRSAILKLNEELGQHIKRRTSELSDTRELLRAVMESAQDPIFFKDCAGRYLALNRSAELLINISEADAVGKTAAELFGEDIGRRVREEDEKVWASGLHSTFEDNFPTQRGNRTFIVTRNLHRNSQNEITGLVTVARDVTDLRTTEHQIRQEHDRLMRATRVGGLGVWDYDLNRDILHCDEQWYRIMGRDPNHPIHSVAEFRPFIHPEDVERATEVEVTAANLALKGEDYGIVFRIIRPNGEIRWIRSAASIIYDLYGVPQRAVGFVIDITEALMAEEHLKQMRSSL